MQSRWVLAAVCLFAALYLGARFDRGWIPHDEGFLAHSAERVLEGELPHRDFTENYTGGLSFLHAWAFELLGVDLRSLRLVLLAFSVAFVAAVYRIARRAAPPLLAAAVTLTALVWSVPNYFAGMPSWYNLFFAAFGVLALFHFIESGKKRWLVIAGVMAGLSFTVKSAGLFFVAAVLLFLVFWELATARENDDPTGTAPRSKAFPLFVALGLVAFVLALGVLISRRPSVMDLVLFLLPSLALALFLLHQEMRTAPRGAFAGRLGRLAGWGSLFLGGALLPVAFLLLPYALSGSLVDFFHGVFVLPQQRFERAVMALPPAVTLLAVLPLAGLVAWPLWKERSTFRAHERRWILVAALLGVAWVSYGFSTPVYVSAWLMARPLLPLTILAGCFLLARRGESLTVQKRGQLFLLLAATALVSLVQFPYSFAIYFCFAAPLLLLALFFVIRGTPGAPLRLHAVVLGVFFVFALVWLNLGWVRTIGVGFRPVEQSTPLGLERADLRVQEPMADLYQRVVELIERHSAPGSYIYAAPDCPQVYFLSARRNPTGTFSDYFDSDFATPAHDARILDLLAVRGVEVVVLNWQAELSGSVSPAFLAEIEQRYPETRHFGIFSVHWREDGDGG